MSGISKLLSQPWKMIIRLQQAILVGLSLYFVILVVAEVLFRYFLKMPLMFVEELCVYSIFWLYLLGAAYGTYDRSHIKGELVQMFFKSSRVVGGFKVGVTFICLVLSVLMSIWGYQSFMWDLHAHGETQMLFLPLAYARLSIFVGFAFMTIYFLAELIDSFRVVMR